ncbi:MAG TPA: DciA family protein [Syntrophales bacterium]|nr:DciA family protein [Syntrophales bacterium]HOX94647.1 DciA family protein [Syntrophales bacterium]HPI56988.1 DciA family protein [Syntrophales bacterium]HPN23882.1 DciA family protein [Syntrophales bacterium]HQM29975.1 DciA family protein [Syntrophales bacterium]
MRRRRRQKDLLKLSDVLQRALKQREVFVPFEDRKLMEIWQESVGLQIATRTHPENIRRGTLFVKVATSVWMQQLQYMKKEIIEKMNRLQGGEAVRDIRFVIGEISPGPADKKRVERPIVDLDTRSLTDDDKKEIASSLSSVGDEELRDILKRVMTREKIREKKTKETKER